MIQKLFLSLFTLFCGIHMMAVNLVVQTNSGVEMVQDVALIGKWVFVGTDLQLLDKDGNLLASEAIANIQKISFSSSSTAVENIENGTIVVYPNPTHDVLYINGVDVQTLRVYDLQGRMLQVTEGKQLSVSTLPAGTYLLQIGTQVVRFIKQ